MLYACACITINQLLTYIPKDYNNTLVYSELPIVYYNVTLVVKLFYDVTNPLYSSHKKQIPQLVRIVLTRQRPPLSPHQYPLVS